MTKDIPSKEHENLSLTSSDIFGTRPDLPEAAKRALQEAEQRRLAKSQSTPQKELGGRGGKDPARYNDWEIKGRAIDF